MEQLTESLKNLNDEQYISQNADSIQIQRSESNDGNQLTEPELQQFTNDIIKYFMLDDVKQQINELMKPVKTQMSEKKQDILSQMEMYQLNSIRFGNKNITLVHKQKSKPLNLQSLIDANTESELVDSTKLRQIVEQVKQNKIKQSDIKIK